MAGLIMGCGPGDDAPVAIPDDVMSSDSLAAVIADLTLIQAIKNLNVSNELKDVDSFGAYYEGVWQRHGITEKEFRHSFAFYEQHPSIMQEVYAQSAATLKEREEAAEEAKKHRKLSREEAKAEALNDSLRIQKREERMRPLRQAFGKDSSAGQ